MNSARIFQRGLRPAMRNLSITGRSDATHMMWKLSTQHLRLGNLIAVQSCRSISGTGRPVDVNKEVEGHIEKLKEKKGGVIKNPCAFKHSHFRANREIPPTVDRFLDPIMLGVEGTQLIHGSEIPPVWSEDELLKVRVTHKNPDSFVEKFAFRVVKTLKFLVDTATGFNRKLRTEKMWIDRICFLESIAVVPPMMGAMTYHISSLRKMDSDHGWVKTLLEEAENERMHLMVGLSLKQPSFLYRNVVTLAQVNFALWWLLAYVISSRFCSHFVGYLEEEAVFTYTKCLWDIEHGQLQHWQTMAAPKLALEYWQLPDEATMRDVIFHIRADEDHHRIVNHTLAMLKKENIKITPDKPKK